jgi:hypothetical protein
VVSPLSSCKSLELSTWQRGAEAYDRLFGAVTRAAIGFTCRSRPG